MARLIVMSRILAIVSILILTSSPTSASLSADLNSFNSFIQCFLQSPLLPHNLLHLANSTSYLPLLQSSAQNLRFMTSSTNVKPSAIVTPTSESHISETVKCAVRHDLELRTRSGGHDYEGMSYVSDDTDRPFVVVDLARLKSITIDAGSRTAWVQAGATLGEVYYNVFTETGGALGFPAGICPTVCVGGHISTGGFGAMLRKFGTAADNVVDAKVVGVDGVVVNQSKMGEDLFWALRGGGAASFGVVVAYKLRLVGVPPVVTTFSVYRDSTQDVTNLVTRWQEIAPRLDKNIFLRTVSQTVANGGSPTNINIQVQFISLFLGARSELLSAMDNNFPELGIKETDCTEMTWLESALFLNGMRDKPVEALLNRTPEFNSSFKGKSDFVTKPIAKQQWEEIWRALIGLKAKGADVLLIMEPFGGRMNEVSETAIPFPHRRGNLYDIQYFTRWFGTEEGENKKQLDAMREMYSFMAPYVTANPRTAYYSYKDIDLGRTDGGGGTVAGYCEAREWGEKYFKSNFARLAKIKREVDAMNFFRNEQSIPPWYYPCDGGVTSASF